MPLILCCPSFVENVFLLGDYSPRLDAERDQRAERLRTFYLSSKAQHCRLIVLSQAYHATLIRRRNIIFFLPIDDNETEGA